MLDQLMMLESERDSRSTGDPPAVTESKDKGGIPDKSEDTPPDGYEEVPGETGNTGQSVNDGGAVLKEASATGVVSDDGRAGFYASLPKDKKGEIDETAFTPVQAIGYAEYELDGNIEQVREHIAELADAAREEIDRLSAKKGKTVAERKRIMALRQAAGAYSSYLNVAGGEQLPAQTTQTAAKETTTGDKTLTGEQADGLIAQMEAHAEAAPVLELTPENWYAEFGETGEVETPLGVVKMGENQLAKIILNKRSAEFGMIKPTLTNPDVILEEYDPKDGSERDTKLLFIKTFTDNAGNKYTHFESVTVAKEGREVVISNHIVNKNALKNKLQGDNVLYANEKLLPNNSEMRLVENQNDLPDLVPAQDSNVSGDKGSENKSTNQINDKKNDGTDEGGLGQGVRDDSGKPVETAAEGDGRMDAPAESNHESNGVSNEKGHVGTIAEGHNVHPAADDPEGKVKNQSGSYQVTGEDTDGSRMIPVDRVKFEKLLNALQKLVPGVKFHLFSGEGVVKVFGRKIRKKNVRAMVDLYVANERFNRDLPDRINRQQVPSIWKRLGGIVEGDSQYIRFLATADGTVYGFKAGNDVYMDTDLMNANTPIHEVAGHIILPSIWKQDPALRDKMMDIARQVKGEYGWEALRGNPSYAKLKDSELAEEVWAFILGNRGEQRVDELLGMSGNDLTLVARIRSAVAEFWEKVKDFFRQATGMSSPAIDNMENATLGEVTAIADGILNDVFEGKHRSDASAYAPASDETIRSQQKAWKGFYSTVKKALNSIKQERGTPEQFKAMLLKNGAKQAELDWTGWNAFVEGKKSLTKDGVKQWIESNKITLKEVKNSDEGYNLQDLFNDMDEYYENLYDDALEKYHDELKKDLMPDEDDFEDEDDYYEETSNVESEINELLDQFEQDNYYELDMKTRKHFGVEDLEINRWDGYELGNASESEVLDAIRNANNLSELGDISGDPKFKKYKEPGGENYTELLLTIPIGSNGTQRTFVKDSHWEEPNVVVHVRFDERTDREGRRVLFVEEFQSDWAQEGREKGFGESVPDMPFKKTDQWLNLAFRRMMLWAVANGFDRIAWTTGIQQADRYNLGTEIDRLVITEDDGVYELMAIPKGESELRDMSDGEEITKDNLADYTGREIAAKAIAEGGLDLRGEGLRIGGSGMRSFYDNIVPTTAAKLGKPFGAKVETVELSDVGQVQSLPVTGAMRESVMDNGVPIFQASLPMAQQSKYDFDVTDITEENAQEMQRIKAEAIKNGNFMKAPNGKETNLNERQWLQVRTEAFKEWFGDWEAAAKLQMIDDLAATEIKQHSLTDGQLLEAYKALGTGKNKLDNREVRFVNETYGKLLGHKGISAKQIIPQLKDIFNSSIPIYSETEQEREGHKPHNNFVGYHNYLGKVEIDGKEYYVRFTVQEIKAKPQTIKRGFVPNEMHSAFISDVEIYENSAIAPVPSGLLTQPRQPQRGITDAKLQQFFETAKSASQNPSKVVDTNGEPLVVYRGTPKGNLGNTFLYGQDIYGKNKGFWFAPNYSVAKEFAFNDETGLYGDIKSVFLKINNPLSLLELKRAVTSKKFYDFIREKTGTDSGRGSNKEFPTRELYEKNQDVLYGDSSFDGIMFADEGFVSYIAKRPSQIKSATSNSGNFDEESDDIRFQSLPEGEGGKKTVEGLEDKGENGIFGEDLLNDIIDGKRRIRLQPGGNLEVLAGKIIGGQAEIRRLDPEEERGRTKAGRRNVEASLILGADRRANRAEYEEKEGYEVAERQEKLLERYAKKNDLWLDEKDIAANAERILPSGAESHVYLDPGGKHVTKVVSYLVMSETPAEFIDNRISLHNHLFKGTKYELLGFTKNEDGFAFVVRQPYVEGTELETETDEGDASQRERLNAFMKEKFGMVSDGGTGYFNKDYMVDDLHLNNVLEDAGGNLYFIDDSPRLNTTGDGLEGVREYREMSVVGVEAPGGVEEVRFHAEGTPPVEGEGSLEVDAPPGIEPGEGLLDYAGRVSRWWADKSKQIDGVTRSLRKAQAEIAVLRHRRNAVVRSLEGIGEATGEGDAERMRRILETSGKLSKYIRENIGDEMAGWMGALDFQRLMDLLYNPTGTKGMDAAVRAIDRTLGVIEERKNKKTLSALLETKVIGKDRRGVSVAKSVDDDTRRSVEYIRQRKDWTEKEVDVAVSGILEGMGETPLSADDVRALGDLEIVRLLSYIRQGRENLESVDRDLEGAVKTGGPAVDALELERLGYQGDLNAAYGRAIGELSDLIRTGRSNLSVWKKRELERKREIAREAILAARLTPVRSQAEEKSRGRLDRLADWARGNRLKEFLFSPQGSFNFMLKYVDMNHPLGEGSLYKRFMRSEDGVFRANDRYYEGRRSFREEAVRKAEGVFGMKFGKVLRMSRLDSGYVLPYAERDGSLQGVKMSYGELMYVYMVSRMDVKD